MKIVIRFLCLILCLCIMFCALPVIYAEEAGHDYGPSLLSPLDETEKLQLMAALYEAQIDEVCEAIRKGLISCQELTAYYLKRIETYSDDYNCFITICDNAMSVAKSRDAALADGTAEGKLFGVPIVVKDNIDYEGYPTTNGDSFKNAKTPTASAKVLQNLIDEGAIVLAKTNMCAYAQVAVHSTSVVGGVTKNAYSTHLSPGGSSGGSAVAESLNFAMAALGTDTNSSLRLPAALNGCVSLRVTHGTISREGITTLNSTRDVPGAITRTVKDLAIMLDCMSGESNYAENLNGNAIEGVRLGIIKELSGAIEGDSLRTEKNIDDEIEAAFWNAVEELKNCGAEIIEVSLEGIMTCDRTAGYVMFREALIEYDLDAMIFPTYLNTPHKIGTDENGKYWDPLAQTFINNLKYISPNLKVPEITVPIGNHSNGAGIGLEIATDRYGEQLLLDIVYSYTLRYNHRTLPKGVPNDYSEYYAGTLQELLNRFEEPTVPTWEYEIVDNSVTIEKCNDTQSEIINVPTTICGLLVTKIANEAFLECSQAQTVLIPKTVKSVGQDAFADCDSLEYIFYGGEQNDWNSFAIKHKATAVCDYTVTDDLNGDLAVDEADVIYLARYLLFGNEYPVNGEIDHTGDGKFTYADILRVWWRTLYSNRKMATHPVSQQILNIEYTKIQSDMRFSTEVSAKSVYRGDKITLNVTVSNGVLCDMYGYRLNINPEVFEILDVTIQDSNELRIENFDYDGLLVSYKESSVPTGELCSITLRVRENAPLGKYVIDGSSSAVLDSEKSIANCDSVQIEVICDHLFEEWYRTDETSHKATCSICGTEYSEEHVWDEDMRECVICINTDADKMNEIYYLCIVIVVTVILILISILAFVYRRKRKNE